MHCGRHADSCAATATRLSLTWKLKWRHSRRPSTRTKLAPLSSLSSNARPLLEADRIPIRGLLDDRQELRLTELTQLAIVEEAIGACLLGFVRRARAMVDEACRLQQNFSQGFAGALA